MNASEIRSRARRLARRDSSGASDSVVNAYLEDSIRDFCNDVGGLELEDYLTLSESFDTRTNMALNITVAGGSNDITATDIAITGTNRDNANGTTVASDLQTTIQAAGASDVTVAWTDYYFTLTDANSATITISSLDDSVTYIDAQELLGLTGSDAPLEGSFPQDCTTEASLSNDCIRVEYVEYDQKEVLPLPNGAFMSPEASGDPKYYTIRDNKIRLWPSPTEQKLFHVWYKGVPKPHFAGYQELGLSNITNSTATGLAASTDYYFKTTINNGTISELDITTGADLTWGTVIAQMNAAIVADDNDCEFRIVNGDVRCTSKTETDADSVSNVTLTAGDGGTDLFAALTGFSAFETAVPGSDYLPEEIPREYHQAIVYRLATYLLDEVFDDAQSQKLYLRYLNEKNKYKIDRAQSVPLETRSADGINYTVDETSLS